MTDTLITDRQRLRTQTNNGPRVYFVTLGCPKNEVDTDYMHGILLSSGYTVTDDFAQADVVVLNTCGFIQDAVEESIAEALALLEWRDGALGRKLVMAGCMVSRYGTGLSDSLPEPDAYISVKEADRLPRVLDLLFDIDRREDSPSTAIKRSGTPSHFAYLMISDGCRRQCAYCTIPLIRGSYKSKPLDNIVAEARFLVQSGASEIILIGQDISSWGFDLDDPQTLVDVVREISALEGVRWLRLMYMQPDGITNELLELIAETPNVCNYLDIPLQHASSTILRSMRRAGSSESFMTLIDNIRRTIPDIVLRTTFITGFPGETKTHFSEMVEFVENAAFDYVGVFPYSREPGTIAAEMPSQVNSRVRRNRTQHLRDFADSFAVERIAQRVGSTLEVVVEGDDEEGAHFGRWRGQAPEVDGVVFLDRDVSVGQFVEVKIVDAIGYDLVGEVV